MPRAYSEQTFMVWLGDQRERQDELGEFARYWFGDDACWSRGRPNANTTRPIVAELNFREWQRSAEFVRRYRQALLALQTYHFVMADAIAVKIGEL